MTIKVELINADKAGGILERTLKIRDPELWQTRRRNAAKARAKARKEGSPVRRPCWQPIRMNMCNGKVVERRPMEMLGLGDLNRPISSARADLYLEEMQADRWYFSPDPIVISEQGYVINGQHRLIAADAVDWTKVKEIPRFLVVWGANKKTALAPAPVHRTLW